MYSNNPKEMFQIIDFSIKSVSAYNNFILNNYYYNNNQFKILNSNTILPCYN